MGGPFGCFSAGKERREHTASQLRFLEEQNLELASALNEWQGLVKQLQGEQAALKADNAEVLSALHRQERVAEQQASDAKAANTASAEELQEARAQCHEVKLLWEASVKECGELDDQLAEEQRKVADLEAKVREHECDKAYLEEALEKREKALRMAEQVMDMVDMMQTPRGFQDTSGFNWGGEDLEGPASNQPASVCGLLKGVLGGGLEDGPKSAQSVDVSSPTHSTSQDSCVAAESSASQALPAASQKPEDSMPSVTRSQSPDLRAKRMNLRDSIQATKLVLAESRTSGALRFSAVLRQSDVRDSQAEGVKEDTSVRSSARKMSGDAAEVSSKRRAGTGYSREAKAASSPSRNSNTKKMSGTLSSVRSSSSTGGSGGVVNVVEKGGGSARSSRNASVERVSQGSDTPSGQHTPSRTQRGSSNRVLDSLVGSVVYDAVGPSPILSSSNGGHSVASSIAGPVAPQKMSSLASSVQSEQPDKPQQAQAAPPTPAAGGLAHLVAAAMQPSAEEHKEWLQRQQQKLGRDTTTLQSMGSSFGSQRGSADEDTSLLRLQGSPAAGRPGGASLTSAASLGSPGASMRKVPSIRGPTGMSPLKMSAASKVGNVTGRGSVSSAAHKEDDVREVAVDQVKLAMA